MKKSILIISFSLFLTTLFSQIVVIDAGHGYLANCSNGDGRTKTEINTSHEVSVRLKNLITNNYCGWTVYLTRPNNGCNSWVSVTQRGVMANNWNSDLFLSIHCNAAAFTAYGTEAFWCDLGAQSNTADKNYATNIQNKMVARGHWPNRRVVEDNSYLAFHLGVLKSLNGKGCLSEIGFVTSSDSTKLLSTAWRDSFALGYFDGLKTQLGKSCIGTLCEQAPALACGQRVTAMTSSGLSTVKKYGCNTWNELGSERVYKVVLSQAGAVTATLDNFVGDLDVFILSSKNPLNCVGTVYSSSAFYNNAPAGTYYVVVDGASASNVSAFDLTVNCTKVADLSNSKLTATKASGYNRRFNVVNEVVNYGGLSATMIEMGYYLSTNTTYSSNDIFIGSSLINSLNPAAKTTINKVLNIPTSTSNGNYYILAYVDDPGGTFGSISESNENNNIRSIPISITASGARLASSDENDSEQTNIEQIEEATLIFPNPTKETVEIQVRNEFKNPTLSVYDIHGKLMHSNQHQENIINFDMSSFPPGVYVVHLKNGQFSEYHKVIKE